jgi:glycosyltransferase involved in cell wall biosynthesis
MIDPDPAASTRVAVYTDQAYFTEGDAIYAARAFVVFLGELRESLERLVVVGRMDPQPRRSYYRLSERLDFAPLPWYSSAANPLHSARALAGSVRRFWRVLDEVDAVWLLGPYPLSIVFAALAALRRKRVALGVRQDMPAYIRSRRPGRRAIHLAGDLLERAWRTLGGRVPVVVVGPQLAHNYRSSPRLLEISVSLVREREIAAAEQLTRSYDGLLKVISVGRLDPEKNPLLLADVLAALRAHDPRWSLVVCGDGPLEDELAARVDALGLREFCDLRGHVPIDAGLMDLYRSCDLFLHVSWTEGLPQVLLEAFACGLPVVATAVGGVAAASGDAALLVQPGEIEEAAGALLTLADDAQLRQRLVRAGFEHVREHTLEAESRRVAAFLTDS